MAPSNIPGRSGQREVPFFVARSNVREPRLKPARAVHRWRYRPFVSATPYFLAARAVVNAEDPVGLLAIDAPADEYDPEVMDLVRWRASLTPADVVTVFVRWFGEEYRPPEDMARRIADGINDARRRLEPGVP